MSDIEYIEAICIALPTGDNLWFEIDSDDGYLNKVIKKWNDEHPEFKDTPCTYGAIVITMPKEKYIAIGAQYGGGAFEFPSK